MSPAELGLAKVLRAWLDGPDDLALQKIGDALVGRGLATREGGITVDGATLLEMQDAMSEPGPYTRAQFAAAVDEAHGALHEFVEAGGTGRNATTRGALERAHEALHRVGAGMPRVACANGERDPEAQRLIDDLGKRFADLHEQRISCGHTVADLIGGTDPATGRKLVTKCGACLAERAGAS